MGFLPETSKQYIKTDIKKRYPNAEVVDTPPLAGTDPRRRFNAAGFRNTRVYFKSDTSNSYITTETARQLELDKEYSKKFINPDEPFKVHFEEYIHANGDRIITFDIVQLG